MNMALITGGAGRIGQAVAHRLIAEGWRVALADKDADAFRELLIAKEASDRLILAPLDVTRLEAVRATVSSISATYGPFAALVNAAGGRSGGDDGPFLQSGPKQWRAIVDLHLRGAIGCCHAVLPGMAAAGRGSIVSIAAFEGLRGAANSAVFSAAKAGTIVLAQTLVAECRPLGIRVNSVIPAPPEAERRNGVVDNAALVADAVAFLVSDRSRDTNGACLDVSAGWALH